MRDSHRLLRHGAVLSAAAAIAHPLNLGFQVVAGWLLTTVEYGALAAALAIIALLSAPFRAVRMVVAHGAATDADGGGRSIMRTWLGRTAALGLAAMIVMVLISGSVSRWMNLGSPVVVWLTAVALIPIAISPVVIGRIQGLQLFRWLAILVIVWAATRLGAGSLLMLARPTAGSAIGATALASIVVLVLGFLALRVTESDRERAPSPAETPSLALAPAAFAVIGLAGLQNLDLVIVKLLADPGPAGVYAQASLLGRSLPYLTLPLTDALFPKAAALGVADDRSRHLSVRAVAFSFCAGAVAVAAFVTAPQEVLGILFGADRATPALAAQAMSIVPAFLPLTVSFPAAYAMLAVRNRRVHAVLVGGMVAMAGGVFAAGGDVRITAAVVALVQSCVMVTIVGALLRSRHGERPGQRSG